MARPSDPDTDSFPEVSPSRCPVCALRLAPRDLDSHLISEHGYLRLDGSLLPRPIALSALWDRVFQTGAPRAHEQLFRILGDGYPRALEAELLQRSDWTSDPATSSRLVFNLRVSVVVRTYLWPLVSSDHLRIRSFGRELLMPDLPAALQNEKLTVSDVRRLLDRLCPKDDIWEKIKVSETLARFPNVSSAVRQCGLQLQSERPVACPECGLPFAPNRLESHRLQAHPHEDFQGTGRSSEDAFASRLQDFCARPDATSWLTLVQSAREQSGAEAYDFLAGQIATVLGTLTSGRRSRTLRATAPVIADSGVAATLIRSLVANATAMGRLFALVIAIRLGAPLERGLVQTLVPFLKRKRAPAAIQIAAAAVFLASNRGDEHVESKIIETLTAERRKSRALLRLHELEKLTGPIQPVHERIEKLEARIRVRCPRCGQRFYRPEMVEHLWDAHTLVLDGKRVRKPWRQVERWIRAYEKNGRHDLLERCLALAENWAGNAGRLRLARLFLLRGIKHENASRELLAWAREHRSSLCPNCFKRVPVPVEEVPRAMNEAHGRLSLAGYYCEISSYGFVPRMTLATPHSVLQRGRESKRFLTPNGMSALIIAPLALAAFAAACVFFVLGTAGEWLVAPLLGGVFVAYLVANLQVPGVAGDLDRAVDVAWCELVPQVRSRRFSKEDATFLAGLALSSLNRGTPELRAASLRRSISLMERAVSRGRSAVSNLAALVRLRLADVAAQGEDPLPALCQEVARCFTRELPLAHAQYLLEGWKGAWWTGGNRARLRVLLCDQAFEAGLELSDLLQVAEQVPPLAAILDVNQAERLAQLRLLWSFRATCPWAQWGQASTVFDLARDPSAESILAASPDLLLADRGSLSIQMLGRGLLFQSILFTYEPRELSIKAIRDQSSQQICIDDQKFSIAGDPVPVMKQLERWFRFFFREFAGGVEQVFSWTSPNARPISLHAAVRCPSCRCRLLPTIGRVGTLRELSKLARRASEEEN